MRSRRITGFSAALLALSFSTSFSIGLGAQASTWLTVVGDPANPAIDTVEVDPVDDDNDIRTLKVRVNRAAARESWDKVAYRSYTASVLFNCEQRTARYLEIAYFAQPLWQGVAKASVDYSQGPERAMLFLDMKPNPTQRIIHAACTVMAKKPRSSNALRDQMVAARR